MRSVPAVAVLRCCTAEELRSARHCPAREADCKVSQYVTKGARPLLHPARLRFISHTVLLVVRLHGLVVVVQLRCQDLADNGRGEGQCETRQCRAEHSSKAILQPVAQRLQRQPRCGSHGRARLQPLTDFAHLTTDRWGLDAFTGGTARPAPARTVTTKPNIQLLSSWALTSSPSAT